MLKLITSLLDRKTPTPGALEAVINKYSRRIAARDASVIDQEIDTLTTKRAQLLGIERDLSNELYRKIRLLEDEKCYNAADHKYPRLDPSFLKMTKDSTGAGIGPLPLFAVFSLDRPDCTIRAEYDLWFRITYTSQIMEKHCNFSAFKHLLEDLKAKNERNFAHRIHTVTLSTQFTGAIPDHVRSNIRQVQEAGEFDEIVLIAEVPEWKLDKTVVLIPKGDPLVVGRKAGLFWLIDSFDTTPIEQYVTQEFSQ